MLCKFAAAFDSQAEQHKHRISSKHTCTALQFSTSFLSRLQVRQQPSHLTLKLDVILDELDVTSHDVVTTAKQVLGEGACAVSNGPVDIHMLNVVLFRRSTRDSRMMKQK